MISSAHAKPQVHFDPRPYVLLDIETDDVADHLPDGDLILKAKVFLSARDSRLNDQVCACGSVPVVCRLTDDLTAIDITDETPEATWAALADICEREADAWVEGLDGDDERAILDQLNPDPRDDDSNWSELARIRAEAAAARRGYRLSDYDMDDVAEVVMRKIGGGE